MNHVLIVGDTGGYVQAYEKSTGKVVDYGGYPLLLSDEPYRAGDQSERWWEPIGGTATQMTVAAGLMLVGVNSRSDEETVLKAFRLYRLPDLTLAYLDTPAAADPGGFTAAVKAICTGCSGDPITTTVSLRIDGRELVRRPITFSAANGWSGTLAWTSGPMRAGSTVEVVATVDPENLVDESNETNNSLRAMVIITTSASGDSLDDGWGSNLVR